MVFENKRFMGKVKLMRLILLLLLTIVVVIISQLRVIDQYSFGFGRSLYIAGIATLYIIISFVRYLRVYNYLYYSDNKSQLEIRYYHSVLFNKNYQVVRIPFNSLFKYEIKESALRKTLFLYQKGADGKVVKYSGISISALENSDLDMILANIDSYIK